MYTQISDLQWKKVLNFCYVLEITKKYRTHQKKMIIATCYQHFVFVVWKIVSLLLAWKSRIF